MYLKSISMKAYGPVSNLSYTFRKNEKGNPVPLVIIGKNGCGKTLMFANIVDMLVETKRKLYPSGILEVSDDNYYKIGSKSYINSAANTSVVEIEFGADEKNALYRDIMTRDYQKVNTPGENRQFDRAGPTPPPLKSYTLSAGPTPSV